jgi:hypothetical protein
MKDTIADYRKRYVWKPLLPSYSMPHVEVIEPYQQGFNDGWNKAVAYYKAVGKI